MLILRFSCDDCGRIVLPDPPTADSPAPPGTPLADVWVALAAIAATTERIRSIVGVRSEPRPATPGGPPIVVGGFGDAAFRRVATVADGYCGWQLDPASAGEAIGRIRSPLTDDRPFECSVTPPRRTEPTAATVEAYREAGVDRLVLQPPDLSDVTAVERFVEDTFRPRHRSRRRRGAIACGLRAARPVARRARRNLR